MNNIKHYYRSLLLLVSLFFLVQAKIGIIVNKYLHKYIRDDIQTLILDIQNINGKDVWLDARTFDDMSTPEALKETLRYQYYNNGLEGVILIGDLPIAYYEIEKDFDYLENPEYASFPIDIFLMDLDGEWLDQAHNGDWEGKARTGYYDMHQDGSGDKQVEIWLSRFIPSIVTNFGDELTVCNDYLDKVHQRMYGNDGMERKMIILGNDIPGKPHNGWSNCVDLAKPLELGYNYPDLTTLLRSLPSSQDSKENWMASLREGAEYTAIFEHGTPTSHDVSNGQFSSDEYIPMASQPEGESNVRFYNLYSCKLARYTHPNFMGGCYAWGHNGLVAVGSTKSGSMNFMEYYNQPLGSGLSFGESFMQWLNNYALTYTPPNINAFQSWFYGMTLLGTGNLHLSPYPHELVRTDPPFGLFLGDVLITNTVSKEITFINTTDNPITIHSITINNAVFTTDLALPCLVEANASVPIPVTFAPVTDAHETAIITISTDYTPQPEFALMSDGYGIDPAKGIVLSKNLVSVTGQIGIELTDVIDITNEGVTDLFCSAKLDNTREYLFQDGFEDANFDGWEVGTGSYQVSVTNDCASEGHNSIYINGNSGVFDYDGGLVKQFLIPQQPNRISYSVRSSSLLCKHGYFRVGTNNDYVVQVNFGKTKYSKPIQINGNGTIEWNRDTWYDIALEFDWFNKKIDLYIDGILCLSDVSFYSTDLSSFTRVCLFNTDETEAWFDNIIIDQAKETWFTLNPENCVIAPGTTENAIITFNTDILEPGDYSGSVELNHDAYNQPSPIVIPVNLTLTPPPEIVCFDNFEQNTGWIVNPLGTDNATTGIWERAIPEQTLGQPAQAKSGSYYLITGAAAGGGVSGNDVDGGVTSIQSPTVLLPDGNLTLSFYYFFAHDDNTTVDDYVRLTIVGQTSTKVLQANGTPTIVYPAWKYYEVAIDEFAEQEIYVVFEAADNAGESIIEVGVDDVKILRSAPLSLPGSEGEFSEQ